MTILQVLILAVVQGTCELLPISSSAHVILAEKLMGLDPTAPQMTLLLVMLHTGTMFAVMGPDGRLIKPYLMCTSPWSDLLHTLRDGHGGGDFRIMIREGRKMIYRGDIAVVRGVNLGTSRRLPRLGAHY